MCTIVCVDVQICIMCILWECVFVYVDVKWLRRTAFQALASRLLGSFVGDEMQECQEDERGTAA